MRPLETWTETWINTRCGCQMEVVCWWAPSEPDEVYEAAIRRIMYQRDLWCRSLHAEVDGVGLISPTAPK